MVGVEALEEPKAAAQELRHDVDVELVDQNFAHEPPDHAGAADRLNRLLPGGGLRLPEGRRDPVNVRPSSCFGGLRGGRPISTNMGTWNSQLPTYESGSPISNVFLPISTAPAASTAAFMVPGIAMSDEWTVVADSPDRGAGVWGGCRRLCPPLHA